MKQVKKQTNQINSSVRARPHWVKNFKKSACHFSLKKHAPSSNKNTVENLPTPYPLVKQTSQLQSYQLEKKNWKKSSIGSNQHHLECN